MFEVATVVLALFDELLPLEELELAALELPQADARTIRAEREERRASLPILLFPARAPSLFEKNCIDKYPLLFVQLSDLDHRTPLASNARSNPLTY